MFPGFAINQERLAQLLAFRGRFELAIEEDTRARLFTGEDEKSAVDEEAALRLSWTNGGSRGYWKQLLIFKQLPVNPPEAYISDFGTAILYAQLGQKSKALDSLERAFQQHSLAMTEMAIEPSFDVIRSQPRFQSRLRQVSLERGIQKPGAPEAAGRISGALTPKRR